MPRRERELICLGICRQTTSLYISRRGEKRLHRVLCRHCPSTNTYSFGTGQFEAISQFFSFSFPGDLLSLYLPLSCSGRLGCDLSLLLWGDDGNQCSVSQPRAPCREWKREKELSGPWLGPGGLFCSFSLLIVEQMCTITDLNIVKCVKQSWNTTGLLTIVIKHNQISQMI